jgi:hypothetical protein
MSTVATRRGQQKAKQRIIAIIAVVYNAPPGFKIKIYSQL